MRYFSWKKQAEIKEITVHEFYELQYLNVDYQLIDVREPYEYDIVNLSGKLIPLEQVVANAVTIPKDKKVIIHCRSGKRSATAIRDLENIYGFENLYNLKGGILAYAEEIDNSLPRY